MNLKPVCLDEWLKSLLLETGDEYREKGLAVVCEALPPVTVKADTEHLRRVLTNIMDNSIKYKEKEMVHLQITLEKTVSGVRMTLADDGPGVPEDALPKLFDIFYRGDPARKNPAGGSGLGLAIEINLPKEERGHSEDTDC